MRECHPLPAGPTALTSIYWRGDTLRSRSVSNTVISGMVDIPAPPARLIADWAREISTRMALEPGDVEVMPLARARTRWPDYSQCVEAMAGWLGTLGLPGVLGAGDIALMVCRGARYHHDGEQYGGAAFCNLFLSEDKGQDVHFASLDLRVPLRRGTVLLFDTCQPHGVIRRGGHGFDPTDFPAEPDCTQLFLTWEVPIEEARVARALGIAFDPLPEAAMNVDDEQVRMDGQRVGVCPASGQWRAIDPDD